jgi:quercetin dioxygenase-like cupin family protein
MDDVKISELLGAESAEEEVLFGELAAELGFAAASARPGAGVKRRLMASIGGQPRQEGPGVFVLRQQDMVWRATPFAGVSYKALYLHPVTRMQTVILRLEPGARYPRHRHVEVEQCLVLSGDVFTEAREPLLAGDFEWSRAGTEHDFIRSTNGCELLIIASAHDEMLA